MPRVSVVMNCFNGERYLRQAIDSVFAQTYEDWEIVFWDNASRDASAEIARSYGEKLRYFRSEATTSLGEARNRAFAKARGEYVAMLDVDDLWLPEKLASQVPLLDADPSVGLAYCGATLFDDQGGEQVFFEAQPPCRGRCFAALLGRNFICTGTMLFRREALAAISPLFEPDLTMMADYYLTLKLAGLWTLDFAPEALVRHRLHKGSESSRKWHLFSAETKLLLSRLGTDLPEVAAAHASAIAAAMRAVDLRRAVDTWVMGDAAGARAAVRPYFGRSLAHSIVFLGSWIYPWPLPIERARRLKYRLYALSGRPRPAFRPHGREDGDT